jgi:hypothetical protein
MASSFSRTGHNESGIDRLVDLHRLVKSHYYHPQMRGSFSMKKVLPVIAPDLDYGEFDEVQEGTGAQVAYLYAVFDRATTPERKVDLENKLRTYCEHDTWAMVESRIFWRDSHARSGRPAHESLRPPVKDAQRRLNQEWGGQKTAARPDDPCP